MNYIILIIILLLLILIGYLFFIFDFDIFIKDILKNFNTKEHFSIIFKPNKIYKYNNKIYLLDTNNILIKDKNPIIFNSFKDYQNYIFNLEEKIFEDIKSENNIIELKNKKPKDKNFRHFDYNLKCRDKVLFCNKNFDLISNNNKIYNKEKSKDCQDKICNIKFFDKEKCDKITKLESKESKLNIFCNTDKPKTKEEVKECKDFKKYIDNKKIFKEFCIEKNNFSKDNCLLGEYYKDNLIDFDL